MHEPLSPASVSASENTLSPTSPGLYDNAEPLAGTAASAPLLSKESSESQQRVVRAPAQLPKQNHGPHLYPGLEIAPSPFAQLRASVTTQDVLPKKRAASEANEGSTGPPSLQQFVQQRYPGGKEEFLSASSAKLTRMLQDSSSKSEVMGSASGNEAFSQREIAIIRREAEKALRLLRQFAGK